jgi:hypothetical protein
MISTGTSCELGTVPPLNTRTTSADGLLGATDLLPGDALVGGVVGVEVARHDMPSGQTIYYRDKCERALERPHPPNERCKGGKCHSYATDPEAKKRATRVPGCSDLGKIGSGEGQSSSDTFSGWAEKMTIEGICEIAGIELNEEWLARPATIRARLVEHGLDWKSVRAAAGDRGTQSHDVLQNLSEGVTPLLKSGWDHATVDWWKKRRPEVELVEQVVYEHEMGFAGRFDLQVQLGGKRVLLDLKTSKAPYRSFFVQLNLYRLAIKASGFPEPDALGLVMVKEDGNWEEVPVPIRPEWALDALRVYANGKAIGKAISDTRRMARKEAEAVAA